VISVGRVAEEGGEGDTEVAGGVGNVGLCSVTINERVGHEISILFHGMVSPRPSGMEEGIAFEGDLGARVRVGFLCTGLIENEQAFDGRVFVNKT
jgi:hypothetical protein